jgi:hypothetical protein
MCARCSAAPTGCACSRRQRCASLSPPAHLCSNVVRRFIRQGMGGEGYFYQLHYIISFPEMQGFFHVELQSCLWLRAWPEAMLSHLRRTPALNSSPMSGSMPGLALPSNRNCPFSPGGKGHGNTCSSLRTVELGAYWSALHRAAGCRGRGTRCPGPRHSTYHP